ncbi:transcriptional regulator [Streptomyces sp. NPDC017179]|uniref:transcriptional regulator n=1 Tax=Streptomyces sp. NPDC017179 TaxID=3364979 RepID=UPI0037AF439F
MTVVDMPPPPQLPVRSKPADEDRAWGGLSPMLTRLAAEHATGVLVREHGTLYLDEGRVAHAESPLSPGLDLLLTAHGTLTAEAWRDAVAGADDRQGAAHRLLAGGHLTEGALELCHLGALHDAAYFALAPSSTPGRFRYGIAHPLGPVLPVPLAALEREILRRRELLHRVWPDAAPDSTPLVRTHTTAAPGLTPRQQTLLERIDGTRTATDLARELGRQAFHTLVDVRRLAAAGLVAPAVAPKDEPVPDGAGQTTTLADRLAYTTDPHITLLKRLRDALEAL